MSLKTEGMKTLNLFATTSGRNLPKRFAWMNEASEWSFEPPGLLTVQAAARADFFVDPAMTSRRSSAPFMFLDLHGEFTVSTKVEVEMKERADSGCLMVMSEDSVWAKLCVENVYQRPTIVSVVTRETSDDCNGPVLNSASAFLRVRRSGDCFAFHYSEDGEAWWLARYFSLPVADTVRVGVVAQAPVGDGCRVSFHSFNYSDSPVANLRA